VLFFEALTEKARLISSSSLVNAPLRCGPLFRLRGRRGLMLRRRTAQAPSSRFALSQSLPALITTVLIRVRHGVQHTVAGPDAQWRKSNARYLSRRAALDPQLPFATIDSNAGLCPVAGHMRLAGSSTSRRRLNGYLEAFRLQRTRFEMIAERKLRRRH
jgi:hypothetical protein